MGAASINIRLVRVYPEKSHKRSMSAVGEKGGKGNLQITIQFWIFRRLSHAHHTPLPHSLD
jgi:hypothetical protein